MKSPVSFVKLALFACCILVAEPRLEAQSVFEYDWVGGQPGYSGKIFLDAASSASAPNGGTVADVLEGSYVQTRYGTFTIFDPTLTTSFSPWVPDVIWNSTRILDMGLYFDSTDPFTINWPYNDTPAYGYAAVNYGIVQPEGLLVEGVSANGVRGWMNYEADFTGQWLAVPEPTTLALAGYGSAAFIVFRRRGKIGRHAELACAAI